MSAARPSTPAAGFAQPAPGLSEQAPPPQQGGPSVPAEIGGPKGPEPTRYGDWERNGRCSDF